MRYYKKLLLRDECEGIKPLDFVNKKEYQDTNVWDLKYVSTSDEEDNDSDVRDSASDDESEDAESSEEEEDSKNTHPLSQDKRKNLFAKSAPGQGDMVPDIARQLKPQKAVHERVRYEETYKNENGEEDGEVPMKSLIIRKKSERQGPTDLIALLTREKQALWEREQNMKLLRAQDETEWDKLVEDMNGDTDEDEEEENFAWYSIND
jgi:hypothetical protein